MFLPLPHYTGTWHSIPALEEHRRRPVARLPSNRTPRRPTPAAGCCSSAARAPAGPQQVIIPLQSHARAGSSALLGIPPAAAALVAAAVAAKLSPACVLERPGDMDVEGNYGCKMDEHPAPPRLGPAPARQQHPPQPPPPPHHSPLSATSPARHPLPPLSLKPLARSFSNPIITSNNAKRAPLVPRAPLRKGKWTPEEEVYAHYIIDNFNKGLISLTRGTYVVMCHLQLGGMGVYVLSFPPSLPPSLPHSRALQGHSMRIFVFLLPSLPLLPSTFYVRVLYYSKYDTHPPSLPPTLPPSLLFSFPQAPPSVPTSPTASTATLCASPKNSPAPPALASQSSAPVNPPLTTST